VADRDRPDDDDLDFEFFDEPATEAPTRIEPPRRSAGPEQAEPIHPRTPGGGVPIVRIAAIILGVIVIAVALVFGINSCRGDDEQGDAVAYLRSVQAVATASNDVGQSLTSLLETTGLTLEDLETGLAGLAEQHAQVARQAGQLVAPPAFADPQESLVEAMQLRAAALNGLALAAGELQLATSPEEGGTALAAEAERIIGGNVVYDDLFKGRAEAVLKEDGITGVEVPESPFLADPELLSVATLTAIVDRIINAAGGDSEGETGRLHGNGIVSVSVVDGEQLSPDEDTIVNLSDTLAFEIVVENSGDFLETNVRVTLTIQGDPSVERRQRIRRIGPGEQATVRFESFPELGLAGGFATSIKVAVRPVDGETNIDNNTAEYPVIFGIPE
jgi:hypothetical protein